MHAPAIICPSRATRIVPPEDCLRAMSRRPTPRASRRSGGTKGGTPAPSFSPTDISGCVLWLQSNLGITQSAGEVTAWADQSGAGNNYAKNTATGPAYSATGWGTNNRPTLTFDGSKLLVGSTSILGVSALTILVMFSTSQAPGGDVTAFGMRYNAFHYSLDLISGGKMKGYLNGAASQTDAVVNGGSATRVILSWDKTVNSGRADLYVANVLQATLGTDTSDITANNDKNAIGGEARLSSADAPQFSGIITMILAYSRQLNSGERGQIDTYASGY